MQLDFMRYFQTEDVGLLARLALDLKTFYEIYDKNVIHFVEDACRVSK